MMKIQNKSRGKRMTKQRKKILEVLKKTDCHPTADWVYEKVKKDIPNISLGTVYRNLNVLSEMGKIKILNYGSSHSRFDGNIKNHYHFHCNNCQEVFDIKLDIHHEINEKLEKQKGFKALEHRLEFYGLCSHCLKK